MLAPLGCKLGEVGDVRRFPSEHHFAIYNGTAPLEYSSGGVDTHRLSRAGNRKLNHALHIIALSHKRYDVRGGKYYARKLKAGKGKKGALRCLKRRLSDAIFRTLVDDRERREVAGPVGQSGRLQRPTRLTDPRWSALRRSHLPDPPPRTLRATERSR